MRRAAKIIGIVAGGIILIVIVIAIATSGEGTPTPAQPQVTEPTGVAITAAELCSAYEDNEIAADAQYKGEVLDITGVVESISKVLGTPFVVLTDGDEWALCSAQCFFSTKDEPILAQLSKGQVITVRGKCDGYFLNVTVKNCKVIQS